MVQQHAMCPLRVRVGGFVDEVGCEPVDDGMQARGFQLAVGIRCQVVAVVELRDHPPATVTHACVCHVPGRPEIRVCVRRGEQREIHLHLGPALVVQW